MNRYCFLLHVRPDRLAEYRERHAAVWPDMQQALRETGWHNYTIFTAPDGLVVGYVEAEDLQRAQQAMAATEVNGRWQATMAPLLVPGTAGPRDGLVLLTEAFHLDGPVARGGAAGSGFAPDGGDEG